MTREQFLVDLRTNMVEVERLAFQVRCVAELGDTRADIRAMAELVGFVLHAQSALSAKALYDACDAEKAAALVKAFVKPSEP